MNTDRELNTEEPKTSRERAAIENLDRSTRLQLIAEQSLQNDVSLANRVKNDAASFSTLVNANAAGLANRINQNRETFDSKDYYDAEDDENRGQNIDAADARHTQERIDQQARQAGLATVQTNDILIKALAETIGTSDDPDVTAAATTLLRHRCRKAV